MAKTSTSGLLTTKGIAAMKPGEWLADPAARGAGRLQVRKLASGELAWYYRYTTPGGARDRLALGSNLSLAQAREAATVLARRYQAGDRDLRAVLADEQAAADHARREAQRTASAEDAQARATLGLLAAAYVSHLKAAGKPSWSAVKASFNRNVAEPFPSIDALPAHEITVDDVMPVFHRLTKEGKVREAEKLRAYLRAAYTAARRARTDAAMHAFAGFQIRENPLVDLDVSRPKEAAEKAAVAARERKWALSEAQLAAYWRRIQAMDDPQGAMLILHLLTGGQRVEQLVRLTASDYDQDTRTIKLLDTKGRRRVAYEHVVPLLPEAEKALARIKASARDEDGNAIDAGPYLVSIDGGASPAGYHHFWEAVNAVAAAMVAAKEVDRVFSPGTIRKTVETRLAAKGVPDEVLARLASHGLGGVQARNYNAHRYDDEKRAALRKLRGLCDPPKSKVVDFKRRSG